MAWTPSFYGQDEHGNTHFSRNPRRGNGNVPVARQNAVRLRNHSLHNSLNPPICYDYSSCSAFFACTWGCLPVAFALPSRAAHRKPGAPPATDCLEAQASQAQAQSCRQTLLGARSPPLVAMEAVSHRCYAGDCSSLALSWLSHVLEHNLEGEKPRLAERESRKRSGT